MGSNDYKKLQLQWHPAKNGELLLSSFSYGSDKKVWWQCEKGHEWEASIGKRYAGGSCSICSGKKILLGFNDLPSTHPIIANQWNARLNSPLLATDVSAGSSKKVWWQCEKGHEWEAVIAARTGGRGCPVCSNRLVVKGINDIATTHPEVAAQFHPNKNTIPIESLHIGSYKRVWWQCEKGHEWEAVTESRKKHSCPKCGYYKSASSRNHKRVKENNLATTSPRLAKEFSANNFPLTASMMHAGSRKKVWWQCEKGHEWEAVIRDRVKGSNCHYCTNRKALSGYNDLTTTHPHLAADWNFVKNHPLLPTDVTAGQAAKIWWLCKEGHEWEAELYSRNAGNGCPECSLISSTSQAEKELAIYLSNFTEVQTSNRTLLSGRVELDIFIPQKKIAIEYNGLYWHSEKFKYKSYHYDKWVACKEKGLQLIQIWEDEWNTNPNLVKQMLLHKLNLSEEPKVFARKTKVITLAHGVAKSFLDRSHIQGFSSGSYYLGLVEKDTDNLVAVLVLKKEAGTGGKTLNIIRYATSVNVVGGFTKLLKYAEKTYQPEKFITFSDNCVSDGGLYANNGFIADKELAPDYMYVTKNKRNHKFGYRLKRFRNDPELQYVEGYTERQLAELNSLERIWDAGKTRWVKALY